MPTIKQFADCRIVIYFDDHDPPHFHVITSDRREAIVRISDCEVLTGLAAREFAEAHAWAMANRELLLARWKEFN
ncbi:DUF4160 domain-containing protein [Nisaea acidiphila]|uniref:DUF4160 domain-containing protein n=1 Tax=Nisaea acidiphila TaxID=1862145 RepID=A0A9J7AZ93_9PROT|nr:DUF4160 domain-containing protein [Nisaea acidiphila]UUX52098.1 DUF4160 domain-containing protein [Nisaea acidiphila]